MANAESGLVEFDAATVSALIEAGEAVLVDVREAHEYQQEHIAGSLSLPMSEFTLTSWPSGDGKRVVITCQAGMRSAAVASDLLKGGHASATHMKGGVNAWKNAGLPVEEF